MVEKYTLSNGIPVFIVENHASPVVSIQVWFSRGSSHESEKVAGISHFLEHALFKGTRRRRVGQIASEIESRGGEINAFTSFEETAYYTTLASRYFEDGLDVLADAVQNPAFDKDEMLREREVIIEEIKRAHDSPFKMVSTNLWKATFSGTSFGRPVLGFEKTVRKIDHKALHGYFSKQYHAGTMSVFVVGDVDKQDVIETVKRKFNRMRALPLRGLPPPIRIGQSSAVQVIAIARDLKECHVQIGVGGPDIRHPSIPALDLACTAIGQGESSRLYQRLVKHKRLALDVQMGLAATGHCSLATLSLVAAPESLEAAVEECLNVVREAAGQGIREDELERVKTSLESEVIGGKETVEGYARRLGYYYVQFGDPEYERVYLDALIDVDTDKARDALRDLLGRKMTLSVAHPTALEVDRNRLTDILRRKNEPLDASGPSAETFQRTQHGSMVFITKKVTSLPIVSVRWIFPGGSREEAPNQYGLAQLFQRVWTSGTKSYSSLEMAKILEGIGASLYAFCGRHTVGLSAEFLSKHWPTVKPLVSEVLLQPSFPEDEFNTEKELMLREILSERDSPSQVCQLNFMNRLYGDHPYGRSAIGTQETVSRLTPADLRNYYRNFVHRGRLVVSSVGSLDREAWIREMEGLLGGLSGGGKQPTAARMAQAPGRLSLVIERKQPLFQAHLMIGFLGASLSDPERYALKLLSSCLAGQGGRLFLELRDKQSLAYQVAPMNSDNPERGLFAFYIGCSPEKIFRSISGIRQEIEKVLEKPMSARELDRAKKYWIGRFELDMQRFSAQAMLFGLDEFYGVGFDQSRRVPDIIKKVTAEEIRAAAQKFLRFDHATLSIVHPEAITEDAVHRAWENRS
jgi:zinc protease